MNFATSDSFFNVIYNDFMQTNWDLTSFDISTKNKNYAEQRLAVSGGGLDLGQLSSSSSTDDVPIKALPIK